MNIWLCDLTYDQQVIAADTMPTNIGYLASYVISKSGYKNNFRLFKYPSKLAEAMNNEQLPDVIGFSHFVWNSALSIKFAKKFKKLNREIVTIFGGLEYPEEDYKKEKFLKEQEQVIDFYVYKEGEIAFLNLVNLLHQHKLNKEKIKNECQIIGAHYVVNKDKVHITPPAQRVKDLMSIPSPYLTGLLDEFFDKNLMPVLTTNRGCPFTCTFCAEGNKYYSVVNKLNLDRVRGEIEYIAKRVVNTNARKDIYISDSNFGMYKEDLAVADIFAEVKQKYNWPQFILATTGKNHKTRVIEVSKKLKGDLHLSGSVQSLDPVVQKNIKRQNIDTQQLMELNKESLSVGTNTYSEIILGLPGDSLSGHYGSLEKIINAKYSFVLAWQLVVLKGTEIDLDETREKYGLKTKYRVLTKSYGNYEIKKDQNIAVAEIEEIVIAGKSLSFDDYLNARVLNLVINIFYNDNFLYTFMKIIDVCKINRFDWILEILKQSYKNENISKILNMFKDDTRTELWDDKNDLIKFVEDEKNVKKFVDGEYGANLLAKYRVMSVSKYIEDILNVAKNATLELFKNKKYNFQNLNFEKFLDEIEKFEYLKKKDFFYPDLTDDTFHFEYDIIKFLTDFDGSIDNFDLKLNKKIKFFRNDYAKNIIKNHTELFGTTYAGIYKQITRTNISRLYRETNYE